MDRAAFYMGAPRISAILGIDRAPYGDLRDRLDTALGARTRTEIVECDLTRNFVTLGTIVTK